MMALGVLFGIAGVLGIKFYGQEYENINSPHKSFPTWSVSRSLSLKKSISRTKSDDGGARSTVTST
ncbi:hypothetical protein Bpfe_010561, partial [Biomphalaria pfeifferi]